MAAGTRNGVRMSTTGEDIKTRKELFLAAEITILEAIADGDATAADVRDLAEAWALLNGRLTVKSV